jgi:predicted GNAT family N-acyltransferase
VHVEVVDGIVTSELRRAVLRPTWPPGSAMHGDGEPEVLHLAARYGDGLVVGACALFPRPYPLRPDGPPAWQLRGMATAEAVRGQGVGGQVIAQAVREVHERGGRLLWCEAREKAIAFYAANGFHGEGELYLSAETGIPHQLMWRELSERPGSSS